METLKPSLVKALVKEFLPTLQNALETKEGALSDGSAFAVCVTLILMFRFNMHILYIGLYI